MPILIVLKNRKKSKEKDYKTLEIQKSKKKLKNLVLYGYLLLYIDIIKKKK